LYSQSDLKDTLRYEIIYKYSYQENDTDTTNIKMEDMILKISKDFSYYISLNSMRIREVSEAFEKTKKMPSNLNSITSPKIYHTILKNYVKNEMTFSNMFGMSYFSYSKKIDSLKWTLNDEKKDIIGYSCQKATTSFAGRNYTAWFAVDIPISDGPYKFNGLPGLIFTIYDTKKQYSFEITSIKNTNAFFDTKDPIYSNYVITYDEYKTIENKFIKKPSSMMNTGGIQLPKELLDKADRRAKEKLKYQNNPMELKNDE
tara:strand:+ start:1235 stop:2008 length:774 start_codon:yes stop_codon:yes gene_type:complete